MLDFEHLNALALNEWPQQLRLPVRASETGHQVEGLADLERSISGKWTADSRTADDLVILMRTLHWNILRAVHLAFARHDVVEIAALPSVRVRFEEDLRILGTSLHVTDADRATIRSYLAMHAMSGPAQPYPAAARRPDTVRERVTG